MRVDLHNHTKLCNHAEGEIDDYIKRAIEQNIDIYGFSDHAPMRFDPKYRMDRDQADSYEKMIEEAKERYKGDIEILLGYEVDFLPNYLEERILSAPVDYLIGSVHFLPQNGDLWGFDNPEFIGKWKSADVDEVYEKYFDAIEAMAKSGFFQIVGHLDLIKVFGHKPKKDIRLLAKKALAAIKKSGMAVEISSAGLRKPVGEPYPSKELLEEIYALGIPVTFASDAHSPDQVGFKQQQIYQLAKSIGFSEQAIFRQKQIQMLPL